MTDSTEPLLAHIREKRGQLERFLQTTQPRKRRLINLVIYAGSLSAVLTAAPAVGGSSLTNWLTGLLGLTSPSWQLLCATASLCSLLATIATQQLKSHNLEQNIGTALRCRAKLELLEVGIASGQIASAQAGSEYMRCVEEAATLELAG
jgi:hypothetical protein